MNELRDRDLVRLYWPVELRPALDALMAIDDAFADVVTSTSQPALGAIRLVWWRDALERLDSAPPPAEPRLEAAARELLPRGISGQSLSELEAGWSSLLEPEEHQSFTRGVARRGPVLFKLAARLMGSEWEDALENAAQSFASADLARRELTTLGAQHLGPSARVPRRLRPLTAFAALAYRDMRRGGPPFEPEATPGRAWTLLRHRLTGRL